MSYLQLARRLGGKKAEALSLYLKASVKSFHKYCVTLMPSEPLQPLVVGTPDPRSGECLPDRRIPAVPG